MAEIEITIKRKKPLPKGEAPRGPLTIKRDSDYISRRKKSGFIKVYDLGYRFNGSTYVSNSTQVIRNFDFSLPLHDVPVLPLTSSDCAPLIPSILTDGVANFKHLYKQIKRGENSQYYGLLANLGGTTLPFDALTEWTTDGFKVRQDQLDAGIFFVDGQSMFNPISSFEGHALHLKDGYSLQKITATPVYTDASVTFTPDFSMRVYLMPALVLTSGFTRYRKSDGPLTASPPYPPVYFYRSYLNYFYIVKPREWVVEPSSPYFNNYSWGATVGMGPAFLANYTTAVNTLLASNSVQNSRGITLYAPTGGDANNDYVTFSNEFSYIPPGDISTVVGQVLKNPYELETNIVRYPANGSARNGILMAVVEKGGQFYYFWSSGF